MRFSRFNTTAENEAAARQFDQDLVKATTIVLHPTSSSAQGTSELQARYVALMPHLMGSMKMHGAPVRESSFGQPLQGQAGCFDSASDVARKLPRPLTGDSGQEWTAG
jgi:hypothetical protein